MSAKIIYGGPVAARLNAKTAEAVGQLRAEGLPVRLDAVMVGDPAAGTIYARSQETACATVGIGYHLHALPPDSTTTEISDHIRRLNADPEVTGILLNLPLPEAVDTPAVQYAIDPYKDVEGVNPANIGLLFYDSPIIAPCTALAVMEILKEAGCDARGQHAVVVGQSAIAGRPIALFLQQQMATVTGCNIATRDLATMTRQADILIAAAGVPGLIGAEHVEAGAVVIDVGINRVRIDGRSRVVGDVRFDEVARKAGAVTPVPGGVGPITVAILLRSAMQAARNQRGERRIEH